MRTSHPLRIARVVPALGSAATAFLLAGLTACADAPTGPAAPAVASAPTAAPSRLTGTTSTIGDTAVTTLQINPTATTTWVIGGTHKVQIVAGSVCDPRTSGYGPALWDVACAPAVQPITVTAKSWTRPDGHPMVSFSPDLRFVPGKVNTLWLMDKQAAAQQTGTIAWCPSDGSGCVDESATDPSVGTQYGTNGFESRRLKHFSGYTVIAN